MSKNTRWTPDDMKRLGLVEHQGSYRPVSGLVAKKVTKIDAKQYLEEVSKPKGNAKIKNATKTIQDGIKFDSRLELYMYNCLKASGINFEFQKEFILQDKFRYGTEAIRQLKIIVDFVLPNMIVDTKGFQTYDGKIKHKLLKWHLYQQGQTPEIIMPKNKKECEALINRIRYGK